MATKKTPEEIALERRNAVIMYREAAYNLMHFKIGEPKVNDRAKRALTKAQGMMMAAFGKSDAEQRMTAITREITRQYAKEMSA